MGQGIMSDIMEQACHAQDPPFPVGQPHADGHLVGNVHDAQRMDISRMFRTGEDPIDDGQLLDALQALELEGVHDLLLRFGVGDKAMHIVQDLAFEHQGLIPFFQWDLFRSAVRIDPFPDKLFCIRLSHTANSSFRQASAASLAPVFCRCFFFSHSLSMISWSDALERRTRLRR